MKFRIKALLLHLLISLTVAATCLVLVFQIWYPAPLDIATGVTKIFLILLVCDVILGPVLTFVVANPRKKYLKVDFALIGLVQISALIYGLWTVEAGRPVWLVFSIDRFDLVQSYELDNPYREQADAQFSQRNWSGPKWVAAQLPTDVEQLNNLTFEALMAGIDVPQRPDLYVKLNDEFDTIINKARPLSELQKYNSVELVNSFLHEYPQADAFLPLMSRAKQMTVLIDSQNEKIISIVDLVPWE